MIFLDFFNGSLILFNTWYIIAISFDFALKAKLIITNTTFGKT